ncbi:MAG: CapA family protein [Candidatus Helarchaeota archaeon]
MKAENWMKETPRKKIATPYSLSEKLIWIKNNLFGPSKKFKKLTQFIPQKITLNTISPEIKLGFLGDIMQMREKEIRINPDVTKFFEDVDYLIGNFEGIISTKQKAVFMAQRHSEKIIATLKDLFPSNRFILGCANNHSGDFGWNEFNKSYEMLKDQGFLTIGRRDEPFILLEGKVGISNCTNWSNQPETPYIRYLSEINNLRCPQAKFNILFPHWGYEVQLYPNPKQIALAKTILKQWDMIVGHHSHCPQPLTAYTLNGISQVVAYSLGDFCVGINLKKYQWGIVTKMTLGFGEKKGAIGQLEWKFTHTRKIENKSYEICLEDTCRYFKEQY